MENHVSWLTHFVNHYLGSAALALLTLLHIKPSHSDLPIPEYVVMSVMVLLIATVLALVLKSRLSVEKPGAMQQAAEMLLTNPFGAGIRDLLEENAGHRSAAYIAMVGSVAVFVLLGSLLSVVPLFSAPTGNVSVPLGCAIITFLYFNWQGIRRHGVLSYLKHFCGPVWWMAWLIFIVEIVSVSARIMSLTVRLWANIFSSDLIYGTILNLLVAPTAALLKKSILLGGFVGIFAATLPVAFILLHVFVAFVQALVFTILPAVYIGLATAQEEH
jgi:F-type H+-transporting ATPase subunit a